jgi:hypothetical protein
MLRSLGSWSHDRRRLVLILGIAALFLGNGTAGGTDDVNLEPHDLEAAL